MKVVLNELCGEFCTERKNPGLPELIRLASEAIRQKNPIEINRGGVLILSVSFMNEFASRMADQFVQEDFESFVSFSPSLEELYVRQVQRQFVLKRGSVKILK